MWNNMRWLTHSLAIPVLVAASMGVIVIFTTFPQVDLTLAKLYFVDGAFLLHGSPLINGLRMAFWNLSLLMVMLAVFALSLAYHYAWPQRLLPIRDWNVILWGFLLGPGLLVNVLLKGFSERARPRDILSFGGDKFYTPIGQLSGQCDFDCSFVSGEVSGTTMFCLACIVLIQHHQNRLSQRWQYSLYGALAVIFTYVFVHRVLTGGHFVSDAILGALFTALVAALVARYWPQVQNLPPRP
jgi:lipid A 4'-phosphatase